MMRGPRGYLNLYKNIYKNYNYQKESTTNVIELVDNHFKYWSDPNHINREGFEKALDALEEKPSIIVETGTSAWGTDSTRLWDSYIRKFGGQLLTCDIRLEPKKQLNHQLSKNTNCFVGDSVDFLHKIKEFKGDLYYLDSFDLDLNEPFPSAEHGLKEFMAILDNLTTGTLLLIDDTPSNELIKQMGELSSGSIAFLKKFGVNPGKGAFIKKYLENNLNFQLIYHHYSYLVKIL